MTIDFFNSNGDQIFIVGYKEKGYQMTLYTDEDMILSYDELKKFANTLLVELEKETSNGNL